MSDEPYVICMSCGWLHVGVPHDQPAGDVCFRCKGSDLAEISDREARVRVPRGVTIQAVHWPPHEIDWTKPAISPEEIQRRREHVRAAIANNRLEGITTSTAPLEKICEAYIRGEIEAGDLVTAYRKRERERNELMIDWSQCPDVESVPGRCSGQPVVKGTRIPVQAILDNAEDCSAEEIAGPDIFPSLSVEIVRRILAFAGIKALDYSDIPPLDDVFCARATRQPTMTDSATPLPLRGEEWLAALLLAMVVEHCAGSSREKRRQMTSYFMPDPSPGDWLNSYNIPANAAAMQELAGSEIEIVEQDGARIIAKLTPTGRALLDRIRSEQQRHDDETDDNS